MSPQRYQSLSAVLLGGVGGAVDAIGYLTFSRLFMGAMSGNSVLLGINLGQGHWGEFLRYAFPILLFSLGTLAGLLLSRKTTGPALVLEAVLLTSALGLQIWGKHIPLSLAPTYYFPRVALLSAAMGAQAGALRRVGGQSLHTTFVTGDLTTPLARWVSTFFPARSSASEDTFLPKGQNLLLVSIWGIYVLGAVAGAFAVKFQPHEALLFPLLLLAAVLALSVARPATQS